ncbi:MAG: DUF4845 domain-containing protein [Bermanella sp.]
MNKQKGSSSIFILMMMVLAFSGFFTLLRVVPLYTQDWSVETVLGNIQQESKSQSYTRSRVYDMIQKRFGINGVDELMEFVEVSGQGTTIIIDMAYERRVPLIANIELVATFNHNIDLSE